MTNPLGPTTHQMSVNFYVKLFSEITSSLTNKKLKINLIASKRNLTSVDNTSNGN